MLRLLSASTAAAAAVGRRSVARPSHCIVAITGRRSFAAAAAADHAVAAAQAAAAAAAGSPVTPAVAAAAPSSADSAPAVAASSIPARPKVRSAQLRAQRPRASSSKVASSAANPDGALSADKCGPVVAGADEPEMVNVVNPKTGERLGPRGLEPTRYGDWEAKGRCWDF